jgi:hypothetical protein
MTTRGRRPVSVPMALPERVLPVAVRHGTRRADGRPGRIARPSTTGAVARPLPRARASCHRSRRRSSTGRPSWVRVAAITDSRRPFVVDARNGRQCVAAPDASAASARTIGNTHCHVSGTAGRFGDVGERDPGRWQHEHRVPWTDSCCSEFPGSLWRIFLIPGTLRAVARR